MKKIMTKYAKKMVDNRYYSTITIAEIAENSNPPTKDEGKGYILAPYVPIITKTIVVDENGIHEKWQIGYWMRFKLFLNKIFHKKRKIKLSLIDGKRI